MDAREHAERKAAQIQRNLDAAHTEILGGIADRPVPEQVRVVMMWLSDNRVQREAAARWAQSVSAPEPEASALRRIQQFSETIEGPGSHYLFTTRDMQAWLDDFTRQAGIED